MPKSEPRVKEGTKEDLISNAIRTYQEKMAASVKEILVPDFAAIKSRFDKVDTTLEEIKKKLG